MLFMLNVFSCGWRRMIRVLFVETQLVMKVGNRRIDSSSNDVSTNEILSNQII